MSDFQSIAMRRRLAKVERSLADDHDAAATSAVNNPDKAIFHHRAAESCRARADAYEHRADREEAQYAQDSCR